jgi:hypothetical protein
MGVAIASMPSARTSLDRTLWDRAISGTDIGTAFFPAVWRIRTDVRKVTERADKGKWLRHPRSDGAKIVEISTISPILGR